MAVVVFLSRMLLLRYQFIESIPAKEIITLPYFAGNVFFGKLIHVFPHSLQLLFKALFGRTNH